MSDMISIRRTLTAGCLAAALALLPVPFAANADNPPAEQLLRHFESVVFGSEIAGVAGAKQVQKWVSPIRLSVTEMKGEMRDKPGGGKDLKLSYIRPTEPHIAIIRKHLTTLVRLTGVTSEASDPDGGKPANFVVKLVPRLAMGAPFLDEDADPALLATLAKPGVCYFLTRSVRSGGLFRALIVANAELPPAELDACLLEEMTQAFGLPNDSDLVTPSVFNQKSILPALTDSDVTLLKTLYDKRLPAGTPKADAVRLAAPIIAELQATQ